MEIIHLQFSTLPSTNRYAKENTHIFSKNCLTVVSADMQTEGYGQYGRHWHSPHGNIYASFCFINKNKDPFIWTRIMAEMMRDFLKHWNIKAKIKWPNDLLVNERKIVGILTETVSFENETGIIIGWGMNVNLTKDEAEKIDQPVTSLFLEIGQILNEKEILQRIINSSLTQIVVSS